MWGMLLRTQKDLTVTYREITRAAEVEIGVPYH